MAEATEFCLTPGRGGIGNFLTTFVGTIGPRSTRRNYKLGPSDILSCRRGKKAQFLSLRSRQ